MKKNCLLVLCSLFFYFTQAQIISEKADSLFQHLIDSMHTELPTKGINVSVVFSNGASWEGAAGISSENPYDIVYPGDVYATGSTTKTMTAMCILQLVDEGKLALSDSIGKYLPDFNRVDPGITIRQLLQHQSGVRDVFQHPSFQTTLLQNKSRVWVLEDVVRFFTGNPEFAPGTRWKYSNTNYLLLGIIIEVVTGKSYHENFKERFFVPLGLDSYKNFAFDPVPPEVAHLWLDLDNNGSLDDAHSWFTSWISLFSATGPAGGYFANATDLAKWMEIAMSGSLVNADTWAEANAMVSTSFPGGAVYGLGFMERTFLGQRALGHGGDISYSANSFYFPDLEVTISVLTNDASVISWEQTPVINAFLQTILDCGDALTGTTQVVTFNDNWSVFPTQ